MYTVDSVGEVRVCFHFHLQFSFTLSESFTLSVFFSTFRHSH